MNREEAIKIFQLMKKILSIPNSDAARTIEAIDMAIEALSAEAETDGDMGEVSDGYHTFNQLYHQRAVLFATIVKQNKEKAWKSWKHGDGKFCFDSNKEWFIVGVDTPEGSYTYHYEKKYWDMFDCIELEHGKFWDGHTEEDVTRLLSIPSAEAVQGEWGHMMIDGNKLMLALSEWWYSSFGLEETEESKAIHKVMDEVERYVDNEKSADYWIPCSERLPGKNQEVLFQCHHNMIVGYWMDGDFDGEKEWRVLSGDGWESGCDFPNDVFEPLAWMPLPKPYREDGE